jgi:excisionase family DNA binding protein
MQQCAHKKLTYHATSTAFMAYTLAQAAEATGKSRSTIFRAIQNGKISATRDDMTQGWLIEPAELHRVYPVVAPDTDDDQPRNGHAQGPDKREIDLLREMLVSKDGVIDDLRRRLDLEGEERRRLTAILTDQREKPEPPRRPWFGFGKRS